MQTRSLWEILVPTNIGNKKPVPFSHHKKWDAYVEKISGGITILKTAKGTWISPNDEKFTDRNIPCRVIATREEINQIIDFTIRHYQQEAVMAYRIADEVIIKHQNELDKL